MLPQRNYIDTPPSSYALFGILKLLALEEPNGAEAFLLSRFGKARIQGELRIFTVTLSTVAEFATGQAAAMVGDIDFSQSKKLVGLWANHMQTYNMSQPDWKWSSELLLQISRLKR